MMHASTALLVAAFSRAGGLGCLASAGMSEQEFRRELDEVRRRTDEPFAANVAWQAPNAHQAVDWCIAGDVDVLVSSGGFPEGELVKIKDAGIKVFQVVANVSQAEAAEDLGVDGVITKGYESGGLNALDAVASLPLVPMVVDAVAVPVIAAGGIADGRGVAAAFALGAEGVLMGTRFLVSKESPINDGYKNSIMRSADVDTVAVDFERFSVRLWKNEPALRLTGRNRPWDAMADFQRGEDITDKVWSTGQVAGLLKTCPSVEEIFQELVTGYEACIERLKNLPF